MRFRLPTVHFPWQAIIHLGPALRIGGRCDDLDATRDDYLAHCLERLHDAGLVWSSSFSQRPVVAGCDRELWTRLLRILFYGSGQSSRVSGHVRVSTQDAPGDHYADGLHCLRRGVSWRRIQTQTSGRICPPGSGGMGHVSRPLWGELVGGAERTPAPSHGPGVIIASSVPWMSRYP